jgi:alkanesulfonate monooxygenase SsuD/methylene tetrahydromethanopterin reductase-like flavin-dependent oxidoreductase (luciferase family)
MGAEREGLRLGIFMPNCSYGTSISSYKPDPDDWRIESNQKIASAAEAAGLHFLFPVSRWMGFGGETNYLGTSIETMTWAASLLTTTSRIQVFSTVHVPAFNPLVAAKMGASLDHIGGGRWGINLVSGWNKAEFRMMGVEILEHADRYRRTAQFIEILKGLWTEPPGSFDYESDWYRIRGGYVSPQPVAKPHPPIVNAGSSEDARETVAQHCDWAFMSPPTLEANAEAAADFKARAAGHRRQVRCVSAVYLICRETAAEAHAERDRIISKIDRAAAENWCQELGLESGSFDDHTLEMIALGAGAMPIIGDAEAVAEGLTQLYEAGIDGALMSYPDYLADTRRIGRDIVPRLRERCVLCPAP